MAAAREAAVERQEAELPASLPLESEKSPAWEQIEDGRYQPRRIRGSYHGRELG